MHTNFSLESIEQTFNGKPCAVSREQWIREGPLACIILCMLMQSWVNNLLWFSLVRVLSGFLINQKVAASSPRSLPGCAC